MVRGNQDAPADRWSTRGDRAPEPVDPPLYGRRPAGRDNGRGAGPHGQPGPAREGLTDVRGHGGQRDGQTGPPRGGAGAWGSRGGAGAWGSPGDEAWPPPVEGGRAFSPGPARGAALVEDDDRQPARTDLRPAVANPLRSVAFGTVRGRGVLPAPAAGDHPAENPPPRRPDDRFPDDSRSRPAQPPEPRLAGADRSGAGPEATEITAGPSPVAPVLTPAALPPTAGPGGAGTAGPYKAPPRSLTGTGGDAPGWFNPRTLAARRDDQPAPRPAPAPAPDDAPIGDDAPTPPGTDLGDAAASGTARAGDDERPGPSRAGSNDLTTDEPAAGRSDPRREQRDQRPWERPLSGPPARPVHLDPREPARRDPALPRPNDHAQDGRDQDGRGPARRDGVRPGGPGARDGDAQGRKPWPGSPAPAEAGPDRPRDTGPGEPPPRGTDGDLGTMTLRPRSSVLEGTPAERERGDTAGQHRAAGAERATVAGRPAAPGRPGQSERPGPADGPASPQRPSSPQRPDQPQRPGPSQRPGPPQRSGPPERVARPQGPGSPQRPGPFEQPGPAERASAPERGGLASRPASPASWGASRPAADGTGPVLEPLEPAHADGARRPKRSRRRVHPVVRALESLVLIAVLVVGFSIGHALAVPGPDTTRTRLGDWARSHSLGFVVTGLNKVT